MQFALQLSTASPGCPRAGAGSGSALSEPKGTWKFYSSSTGLPSPLRNRYYLQKGLSAWSWDITGTSVPSPGSGQPEHPSLYTSLTSSKGNIFLSLLSPQESTQLPEIHPRMFTLWDTLLSQSSGNLCSAWQGSKRRESLLLPLSWSTNHSKFSLHLGKESETVRNTEQFSKTPFPWIWVLILSSVCTKWVQLDLHPSSSLQHQSECWEQDSAFCPNTFLSWQAQIDHLSIFNNTEEHPFLTHCPGLG